MTQTVAELHPELARLGRLASAPLAEGDRKTLVFLPVDHPEVERFFGMLPGGAEALNEAYGEVWQYMGTALIESGPRTGRWEHQFRHRAHPWDGRRLYRAFLSSLMERELQAFPGM